MTTSLSLILLQPLPFETERTGTDRGMKHPGSPVFRQVQARQAQGSGTSSIASK